ncbi:MAG: dethiobiotin synthase [Polyangiaceae bacterium]
MASAARNLKKALAACSSTRQPRHVQHVVVLGTGTGVGKTAVSCALVASLTRTNPSARVAGLKPIESGITADRSGSDAARLEAASLGFEPPSKHPLYALPEPLSPHLAARRAGLPPIEPRAVSAWLSEWEHYVTRSAVSPHDWCVIETAGAVLSPLNVGCTNLDLARALEPAIWVLVAADALGTLHDTRATVEALAARGRPADYLVLSAARVDHSTGTNADEMRLLGIANPSAVLARDETSLDEFARLLASMQPRRP